MSKSRIIMSAVLVASGLTVAGAASASSTSFKGTDLSPNIHVTFDDQSFDDVAGGGSVVVPSATESSSCVDENEIKLICNDMTASKFGADQYGSYWKTVKDPAYLNGGLYIHPTKAITDSYTVAVTFSLVDDLETDYDAYTRVITPSIGRDTESKLHTDCGVYLIQTSEIVGYVGDSAVVPGNYCDGVRISAADRPVDVSEAGSEVITLVTTRASDGNTCLYEIKNGGVAARLGACFIDPPDVVAEDHDNEINVGDIGFFMDDNGEIPVSAKIYDIRIWDQKLNGKQLNKAYTTPAAPTNVTAKMASNKVQISWKKAGKIPANLYRAEVFGSSDGTDVLASCSSKGNTCKIALEPGAYWISVAGRNGDGWGVSSARIKYTVARKKK